MRLALSTRGSTCGHAPVSTSRSPPCVLTRCRSPFAHGPCVSSSVSSGAAGALQGHRQQRLAGRQQQQGVLLFRPSRPSVLCRSTLDDPEMADLVARMEAQRPMPPAEREMLDTTLKAIDEINSRDPTKVTLDGVSHPYRVLYSNWVMDWVKRLDPKAPDELLILAKGRNIESWKLSEIKRDAYPPSSVGVRMWEADRKRWLASRLEGVMKEAGYGEEQLSLVREVMLQRDIPDPRDMRRFDLVGPLGTTNFRLLEQAAMVQTLRDAEALVFMEKNFPQMSNRMTAEEILTALKRELGSVSRKCMTLLLDMPWSQVQVKMITKALPIPKRFRSIMLEAEGTAASSGHPGDWRYKDFSYD